MSPSHWYALGTASVPPPQIPLTTSFPSTVWCFEAAINYRTFLVPSLNYKFLFIASALLHHFTVYYNIHICSFLPAGPPLLHICKPHLVFRMSTVQYFIWSFSYKLKTNVFVNCNQSFVVFYLHKKTPCAISIRSIFYFTHLSGPQSLFGVLVYCKCL